MSQYPGVSHTFFLNEILELQKQGITVLPAGINSFGNQRQQTEIELSESARTFYPKQISKLTILATCLHIMFLRPAVFLRGLTAALDPGHVPFSRILYSFFYFIEGLLIGDWMEKKDLTHLHIHFAGSVATVGRIVARAFGVSYSITVHGPEEFYDETLSHLELKVRQAKFVVCISHFCKSQIMRWLDAEAWSRLEVSRLGIDAALFPPRIHENTTAPIEIVCTGRLIIGKGQRLLIEACTRLLQQGHRLHLTIIGDGPDRSGLANLVDRLGVQQHVHFAGATTPEATRNYLAQADIFSLPTFAEGIPVALMEAMACQLPCLTTYIAGIPELITDGVDGLLVPAASIDDLTNAIERLVLDPALRQRIGEAARARIQRQYSLQPNVAILGEIFKRRLWDNNRI